MVSILHVAIGLWLWLAPALSGGPAAGTYAPGPTAQETAAENPLFASDEELRFTLRLPLAALLRDRGDKPGLHPATLVYHDAQGTRHALAVQVRARGHRRKDPAVCGFPPLLIRFSPVAAAAGNGLFGHAQELKLTTHCQDDKYVLREYLVYRLYNVLTDLSFRARLCRVTYQDASGRQRSTEHQAFLLEEAEAMARRNQATLVPKSLFIGMPLTHQATMARLAFFQYMIGNTDWSVPYRHNIRLLAADPLTPAIPVPYDFDYSGLVMTPYAVPPDHLPLASVRQRLFRGHGFSPDLCAQTTALFNARQTAFYRVYLSCPYLDREEKDFARRYLDEFYATLNNPKDFERRIGRLGCRPEPQLLGGTVP